MGIPLCIIEYCWTTGFSIQFNRQTNNGGKYQHAIRLYFDLHDEQNKKVSDSCRDITLSETTEKLTVAQQWQLLTASAQVIREAIKNEKLTRTGYEVTE